MAGGGHEPFGYCLVLATGFALVDAQPATGTPEQMLTTAVPWISPWLPKDYGQDFWQRA